VSAVDALDLPVVLDVTDWFVLDIPRPPSVNRFLGKLGNKSPCVVKWRARADQHLRAAGKYPRIIGKYVLVVVYPLNEFESFDAENCQKALSDWLQSRELVSNDKRARRLVIDWGDAPKKGCRVHVRPWRGAA
jgi:hypothetical protein